MKFPHCDNTALPNTPTIAFTLEVIIQGSVPSLQFYLDSSAALLLNDKKGQCSIGRSTNAGTYYRPGQPNWEYTMWKFEDISTPQILREIEFDQFEGPKTANLTI